MITNRGEVAVELTKAAALGTGFPSSVADTPANRKLWEQILAEVKEIAAAGYEVDIPSD
jgi:hypothetical protein